MGELLTFSDISEIFAHCMRKISNVFHDYRMEYNKEISQKIFSDLIVVIEHEYNKTMAKIERTYLADIHDLIDGYESPRYIEEMMIIERRETV